MACFATGRGINLTRRKRPSATASWRRQSGGIFPSFFGSISTGCGLSYILWIRIEPIAVRPELLDGNLDVFVSDAVDGVDQVGIPEGPGLHQAIRGSRTCAEEEDEQRVAIVLHGLTGWCC